MAPSPSAALRQLPKVDAVLLGPLGQELLSEAPRWAVVSAIRAEIQRLRESLQKAPEAPPPAPALDPVRLRAAVQALLRPSLRPVVNATGVVLHTNLGRAPLAEPALARLREAGAYGNLEYRLEQGERGSRHDHLDGLLRPLTGAEAHLVVNNNAAAVLLMLTGLCAGGEVVVSRGELVEIGGSFRVPDVMRLSGAVLREVGTTNRTHLSDYTSAVTAATRAFMKVHPSNFAVVGFTKEVPLAELCASARERGVLSLCDLGSGALLPTRGLHPDLPAEPTVPEAVAAGCDLTSFSGDKLLGGPQAGILAGRAELVGRLRQSPLLRALRPDKLTLLALSATLELYRDGRAATDVPALAMMARSEASLQAGAQELAEQLRRRGVPAQAQRVESAVGGGSLPLGRLGSWAVVVEDGPGVSVSRLEAALRRGARPVVARVAEGRLVCDLRTVAERELSLLVEALHTAYRTVIEGEQLA